MFRLPFFSGLYVSCCCCSCSCSCSGVWYVCLMFHAFPRAFYGKWCGMGACVCESTSEDSPTYDIKAINHNRLKSNLGFTLEEITYLLRQLLAFHIDTLTAHAMHRVRTIFVCLMCVPRLICMFIRNSLRIKRIYRNIWFLVTSKWFPVIN